jgi:hypothetical protein
MSDPRTTYTVAERVAIGELIHAAELFAASTHEPTRACCAVLLERAANIVRGEVSARPITNREVQDFARFWGTDERARFNPARETRS